MSSAIYTEAMRIGAIHARQFGGIEQWWVARYAARQTAIQLLDAARKAGFTDEQVETLRQAASKVAPD